jgi:hypothetical protein
MALAVAPAAPASPINASASPPPKMLGGAWKAAAARAGDRQDQKERNRHRIRKIVA